MRRLACAAAVAVVAALAVPAAEAHNLNQYRAMEVGTNALLRKYPAAEGAPVVYCPLFPGHVHRIRCNYEFLRGFQLCQGFVVVKFRSRRSHRLRTGVRRARCGVPGGPQVPY